MHDRISVTILAFFLLVAALVPLPYLMHHIRYPISDDKTPHTILPRHVLIALLSVGFSTCLFLVFLGLENTLLALAIGCGIGLGLLHPVAATCFFVATFFLRPWEAIPHNALLALLPRLLAGLTFTTWLLFFLARRPYRIVWNAGCTLFSAFIAWLAICAVVAQGNSVSFFFETFIPISVLAFLIINALQNKNDLKLFTRSFLVSVCGILTTALYLTVRDYASSTHYLRLHSSGMWGNANDLAALAVVALPLALAPFLKSATNPLRTTNSFKKPRTLSTRQAFSFPLKATSLTAVLATGLLVTALLWSQSRGGFLAFAIGSFGYFLLGTKSKKIVVFLLLIAVAASLFFQILPQREEQDLSLSTASRTNYLIAGLRMAKHSPLFGVGPDNYGHFYEQFTPGFFEWGNRTAHSSWVLVLAEAGLLGLVLFSALYFFTLRAAWKIREFAPQYFIVLLSYGVVISFLSHTYLFLPYVVMAYALSATRIHSALSKRTTEKELTVLWPPRTSRTPHLKQPTLHLVSTQKTRRSACWVFVCLLLSQTAVADEVRSLQASAGADKPIGKYKPTLTRKLELFGSRGETILFLLAAEGQGCAPLTLTVHSLHEQSPPEHFPAAFYSLPPITTEHPSFPGAFVGKHLDPAIPVANNSACLTKDRSENWFLGEIKIENKTPPGLYQGVISFGRQRVPLQIGVWRMQIPERPAVPAYAELTPWFGLLGHYGKWHESEAELATKYILAMEAHRIYPLKSTVARPEIVLDNGVQVLDLDQKPSPATSFRSLVLKNRPLWAYYDFPTVGSSGFEKINYPAATHYFSALENTIPRINRPDKAMVYLWDEPQPEAVPELIRLSRHVRKIAPSLKQLVTTTYSPALKSSVDIFVPVINQFDAPSFPEPEVYRTLQRAGKEVWWYVSCMSHGCHALVDTKTPDLVIDRPASYIRSIGWLSKKYHLDAFLYYHVINGYQFHPKRDPWNSLWDFSGNGDGTLFYPGRPGERGLTGHVPIPSLRLKLWRETSYDAEYVTWMNKLPQKPAWWDVAFEKIARSTTDWSREYRSFQDLRERAGIYLDALPLEEATGR